MTGEDPPLPARISELVGSIRDKLRTLPKGAGASDAAVSEILAELKELERELASLQQQGPPLRKWLQHPLTYWVLKEVGAELFGLFDVLKRVDDTRSCKRPRFTRRSICLHWDQLSGGSGKPPDTAKGDSRPNCRCSQVTCHTSKQTVKNRAST